MNKCLKKYEEPKYEIVRFNNNILTEFTWSTCRWLWMSVNTSGTTTKVCETDHEAIYYTDGYASYSTTPPDEGN